MIFSNKSVEGLLTFSIATTAIVAAKSSSDQRNKRYSTNPFVPRHLEVVNNSGTGATGANRDRKEDDHGEIESEGDTESDIDSNMDSHIDGESSSNHIDAGILLLGAQDEGAEIPVPVPSSLFDGRSDEIVLEVPSDTRDSKQRSSVQHHGLGQLDGIVLEVPSDTRDSKQRSSIQTDRDRANRLRSIQKRRLKKEKAGKAGKSGKAGKASASPSVSPSVEPSLSPSALPSAAPSALPSLSLSPSALPSGTSPAPVLLPAVPTIGIERAIACTVQANYMNSGSVSFFDEDCDSDDLFYGPMEFWDTSQLTTLNKGFFYACYRFNSNAGYNSVDWATLNPIIQEWNTESVTKMDFVFARCQFDDTEPDLSGWNTALVKSMRSAFFRSDFDDGGILEWDVSNVNSFASMFFRANAFNQPLGDYWTLADGADITRMFALTGSFSQCMSPWAASNPNLGIVPEYSPFFYADGCDYAWCTCDA